MQNKCVKKTDRGTTIIFVEKERMLKRYVYICGELLVTSPIIEMTCLDNNGDKISVVIPRDCTATVLVKKNEQIIFSFNNRMDFKIFLNQNIHREELQEIFFLWIFRFFLADKKYRELTYKEGKKLALEDTRNVIEERFNLKLNDNIKNIITVLDPLRDGFRGYLKDLETTSTN